MTFQKQSKQSGFVAILSTVLVLVAMSAVALASINLVLEQQKINGNHNRSLQAHLAAESGVEDAILRIRDATMSIPSGNYSFIVGSASADVLISDPIGGSRIITSQGNEENIVRKIEVVHNLAGEKVEFHYGAQVGEGGLIMENGSTIEGNVFSNGSIVAGAGAGQTVTGDAVVAQNGNILDGIEVQGKAKADICNNSHIGTTLYYFTDAGNCTAATFEQLVLPISPEALPVDPAQIQKWKDEAEAGGVYNGGATNYTLSGTSQDSRGPLKIDGNLLLQNSAQLTLTGTLWVVGNLTLSNTAVLKLDEGVYGFTSGVIVVDGTVNIGNNITIEGSGREGSYLMILSTNVSDPAITISNSTDAGVFYATDGFINISNNTILREVTGYGIRLNNSVTVQYESGLANVFFSSGPSGGWAIESWQEIE